MTTEKNETWPRGVAAPEIIDATRAGLKEMGLEMPRAHRSPADCQALLGALMLAGKMGVPLEALEDLETAEGLGQELALTERGTQDGSLQ